MLSCLSDALCGVFSVCDQTLEQVLTGFQCNAHQKPQEQVQVSFLLFMALSTAFCSSSCNVIILWLIKEKLKLLHVLVQVTEEHMHCSEKLLNTQMHKAENLLHMKYIFLLKDLSDHSCELSVFTHINTTCFQIFLVEQNVSFFSCSNASLANFKIFSLFERLGYLRNPRSLKEGTET